MAGRAEHRGRAGAAALLLAAVLAWAPAAAAGESPGTLADLEQDFNADAGTVRLVLLLDPT